MLKTVVLHNIFVETDSQINRKFKRTAFIWNPTDLNLYQSLLSDLSANVSTAKRTYYHDKINNSSNSRMLLKYFPPFFVLLLPLLHQL